MRIKTRILLIENSDVTIAANAARAIFQDTMAAHRREFSQAHPRALSRRNMHKRQFMKNLKHAISCA